ncbi:MAG: serine/threonine-protein kinase PknK [bacterium]|nr:serine/threonine-protein kinase PknK [bacterium]
MHKLEGYQNPVKIYESPQSLVYRAFDEKNKRLVILKVLNNGYPGPEEISKFNREYELTRMFTNEGVIEVYEISEIDNHPAIIMEDIGGRSLADILKSMKLPPDKFLDLAVRITGIIGNIHRHNIIHKDINPSNIIWNAEKNILRIIDFGIATQLPREITSVKNPNVLIGTLAYISPEQSGRMNRSLDYRTDFYSLGITFYWMLSGDLPFKSKDLLELVHSHIAVVPVSLHEIDENIPEPLSKIVMKLMAKNAEDRYLSAHGLKADLEHCLRELRNSGLISPFELCEHDVSDKFQIPQKLYGREQEIRALLSAFERVNKGSTELVLVSGFSGIGKSVLINEIQKPIVKHSGYFISGKFERLKKDVPYSAILEAFSGLARQILAEGNVKIDRWKNKILSALGSNGKIVTDIIPLFEFIIGKQEPVPVLGPLESRNRFNLVLQEFIKILAAKEHPLVIFLDDLQWADLASLQLIKLFTTDPEIKQLCMIGAYRHNETPESHPLMLTLDEIKKNKGIVNTIFLQALNRPDINQLLGDTLNRPAEETMPLAELLINKTGGNPFFILEFLKTLYKESFIDFSFENGWSWDQAGVEAMQATENVMELMAEEITRFSENAQEALKLGACIGSNFDLATLTAISGKPGEEMLLALNEVLQEGMVTLIDNTYRFTHDRIQEAAYSLIPDEEKTRRHYYIGNLELQNNNEKGLREKIFHIVNQLNAGVRLVTGESEKLNLAELNRIAGKKAFVSNAYDSAVRYLKAGIALLPENSWQENYALTLELYREAASAAGLAADYETMDILAEEVFRHAETIPDTIKVYEAKIAACAARNQLMEGIKIGLRVLKKLGIELPEKPGKFRIVYELLRLKLSLRGKPVEKLVTLPEMKDPHKRAVMQMFTGIGTLAYYAVPELIPLITFNTVKLSVKYGNNIYSPYAYATFGIIHCGVLGAINTGHEYGKLALNLVEKLNTKEIKSKVLTVVWYLINHWKNPLRDSMGPLLEAYKTGMETGDLEFAAIAANTYSVILYISGMELRGVEKEMAGFVEMIRKLNQDTMLNYHLIAHQTVLNLLGKSENPANIVGFSYDENIMLPVHKKANDINALFHLYYYLLPLKYLFGKNEKALEIAELVKPYSETQISHPCLPIINFYDSLTRLALNKDLKKVTQNQKKMKKWASHAPMNYSHKYHLVEAEIARVQGRELKAEKHYALAVELAHENKFLNEEALALELTAKFWLGENEKKIAARYMQEAHRAYRLWGAVAKVQLLEKEYKFLLERHGGS